jgi:hypothetical protein
MDEIDVWRTANVLIKLHGNDAGWVAAQRASAWMNQGETVACAMWIKIWRAIKALQSDKPREGEAMN